MSKVTSFKKKCISGQSKITTSQRACPITNSQQKHRTEEEYFSKPKVNAKHPHRELRVRFLGSCRQYCPCSDFTKRTQCTKRTHTLVTIKANPKVPASIRSFSFILLEITEGTFIATMSEHAMDEGAKAE